MPTARGRYNTFLGGNPTIITELPAYCWEAIGKALTYYIESDSEADQFGMYRRQAILATKLLESQTEFVEEYIDAEPAIAS